MRTWNGSGTRKIKTSVRLKGLVYLWNCVAARLAARINMVVARIIRTLVLALADPYLV